MQQAVAASPVVAKRKGRQTERNKKFANDGSYESVEAMLKQMAGKALRRVEAMGLPMDFDDCLAIMNLNYVKARAKWTPDRGTLFSTYCQTACWNNFNESLKKPEAARAVLGLVSIHDVVRPAANDDATDPMEILMGEPEESHEDALIRREEMRERLRSLSDDARGLVLALLSAERQAGTDAPPKLRQLASDAGLSGDALKQVKLEILAKFGVKWV